MARIFHEAAGKMTQLVRRVVHVNIRWIILDKVSVLRRFFRFIWDRIRSCSAGRRAARYQRLVSHSPSSSLSSPECLLEAGFLPAGVSPDGSDLDLVTLKICLLGDPKIGKTSFVIKYVGDEQDMGCLQMAGLNLMGKTLTIQDARISCNIWDVGGDRESLDHVPIACKDSVAILFMFDLTSRCTLNSLSGWYSRARKWNQTAIPILIGTKFDEFVKLPPDLQWTIITQARAYAKAMKATLFFSSATHNINVNKVFKFVMAKLFNLPWTVERNLNIGEPTIDF